MLCQLSGCCYDFTMLCSSNPPDDVSRIIYDSKDWFGFGFHWESIRTGAWIISYQSVKSSGRVNGPMALGMSAWYLQFRQERKVWSWHVTEGSLNGCRTRGQKPFTELLMTMARPYTKTKERVLLGKIEWLLCYSSIVVTEQLVAHSSDVIYSWGKGELVKISKTECTKYWVIILVSPIVIYACFG